MMAFLPAAKADDLWQGELLSLNIGGVSVFLTRLPEGVRAYKNACPHQGVPLTDGWLHDCLLTCSAHQWEFNLSNGQGMNPESARLTTYAVKEEGGVIYIDPESERNIP